jgi:hypothetical protein
MSKFYTEITLENSRDKGNAMDGIIKEEDVRRLTVNALVDTSIWELVISEELRAKLGLDVRRSGTLERANGDMEEGFVTDAVTSYWKNRQTACNAFVLPHETDVIFGRALMAGMDLMVSPDRDEVVGVHGDKPLYMVK